MSFDPYYDWLGIPAEQQPPSHYAILGLSDFEKNDSAIENAADRLFRFLRTKQIGAQAEASQQLLNHVATARSVLLDPTAKQEYDARLAQARSQQQEFAVSPPGASQPPKPPPIIAASNGAADKPLDFTSDEAIARMIDGDGEPESPLLAVPVEAPPSEYDNAWHYQVMGDEFGPVPAYEIKRLVQERTIGFDTPVRRGSTDWSTASRVPGLFERSEQHSDYLADLARLPEPPRPHRFLTSTGDIPYGYEPVSMIFACGSSAEGAFEGADPTEAFRLTAKLLVDQGIALGAHAVIFIHFELRSAVGQGLIGGANQLFEVYAYGTAVRMTEGSVNSWPREW